jgi:hypothetical protein
MRIERLLIENFRSIRHVELVDIPDIAVFYGENGAGKSNVLAAVKVAWELALDLLSDPVFHARPPRARFSSGDRRIGSRRDIHFRVTFALGGQAFVWHERRVVQVSLECSVADSGAREGQLLEVVLEREDGVRTTWRRSSDSDSLPDEHALRAELRSILDRAVLALPELRGAAERGGEPLSVVELALAGRIEEAAARALLSPDPEDGRRLDAFRRILTEPPLNRPPFRPVLLGDRYVLHETSRAGPHTGEVPLDRAGLGVRQLYPLLGGIALSGAPIVTLEEPEAHLHALTTGRQLREVLRKLVPGTVNQLFVATHSELFDLDATGYYEVTLDEVGCTQVTRRTDLVSLDERHTYMPGAARHALMDALHRGEPDRPVFYRADGTAVVASEMVRLLVEDHPDALEYLRDVTAAAVRLVAVRPRRPAS